MGGEVAIANLDKQFVQGLATALSLQPQMQVVYQPRHCLPAGLFARQIPGKGPLDADRFGDPGDDNRPLIPTMGHMPETVTLLTKLPDQLGLSDRAQIAAQMQTTVMKFSRG